MDYIKKLVSVICLTVIFVSLIQAERTGIFLNLKVDSEESRVVMQEAVNAIASSDFEENNIQLLVIYDEINRENNTNISTELEYVKVPYESKMDSEIGQSKIDYTRYSSVIFLVSDWDKHMSGEIYNLLAYVKAGGVVLFATAPADLNGIYSSVYRQLGIKDGKSFTNSTGLQFVRSLMPGTKSQKFSSDSMFIDINITAKLEPTCKVYIESYNDQSVVSNPILWTNTYGKGKVVVFNGCNLGSKSYGGVFAACIGLMEENFIYPIINSSVIFLDDFPAPYSNAESEKIRTQYNRTISEFYRDIWWPDMQKISTTNDLTYTGLFILNYNNIVNPEQFDMYLDPMLQYYGESFLKCGFEIGLHGYNHQPLCEPGFIKADLGYNAWLTQNDMEKSIETVLGQLNKSFSGLELTSYVPPSNYLSPTGRMALKAAMPDLKVISGVYTGDSNSYVQSFQVADDGIVEFPRITSGMFNSDDTRFDYINGLVLLGVFSHFIHPDDILDEERSKGAGWEELLEGFNTIITDVKLIFPGIRNLRHSEAADATKVYSDMTLKLNYSEGGILGACDNFYGEGYFFLRTENKPVPIEDTCKIDFIDENYYLVTVTKSEFKIGYSNGDVVIEHMYNS